MTLLTHPLPRLPLRLCAFARDIFSTAEEGLAQSRKGAKEDKINKSPCSLMATPYPQLNLLK
jgi:hypothetical protein